MKRHPLDVISLGFGLLFVAMGAALLNTDVDVTDVGGRWLLPSAALLLGAILAMAAASTREVEPADPPSPAEADAVGDPSPRED